MIEKPKKLKELILKSLKEYPDDYKFSKDQVAELGTAILMGSSEGFMKAMEKLSHRKSGDQDG